jgi:hypothetical protein
LQADFIKYYLLGLYLFYINKSLLTDVFNNKYIKQFIKGARQLFPQLFKWNQLLIIKSILIKIINAGLPLVKILLDFFFTYFFNFAVIDNINSNTAFHLTFTAFLYIGEFIYTIKETTDLTTFITIKLTRSNICFIKDYNYLILKLKWSKTDTKYKGVSIIVITTGDKACLVTALYTLF